LNEIPTIALSPSPNSDSIRTHCGKDSGKGELKEFGRLDWLLGETSYLSNQFSDLVFGLLNKRRIKCDRVPSITQTIDCPGTKRRLPILKHFVRTVRNTTSPSLLT
jgi:hypothetical protein